MQAPMMGPVFSCGVVRGKNRNKAHYFPNYWMKRLIIKQLEKKLGNPELMVGTDVLKFPLSLVDFINKHHYLSTKGEKVVHKWC